MDHRGLIFLFPGQGAQQVTMGYELWRHYPRARQMFARADEVLGFSLSRTCFQGPARRLNQDVTAQLAVYTLGCILTALLAEQGIAPHVVTGYSSGFYAAAQAAGCFSFEDGLLLVHRAGQILLRQQQSLAGAMGVVFGLDRRKVASICRQVGQVDLAIVNTPRQMVVSGLKTSVARVIGAALDADALDAYLLPARAAYHSRFARQTGSDFWQQVPQMKIDAPRIALISYSSLEQVRDARHLRATIVEQLSRPVLWADLIKTLGRCRQPMVEMGPGRLLARSVRWIDRNLKIISLAGRADLENFTREYAANHGKD